MIKLHSCFVVIGCVALDCIILKGLSNILSPHVCTWHLHTWSWFWVVCVSFCFSLYWTFCSGNPLLDIRVSVFHILFVSFVLSLNLFRSFEQRFLRSNEPDFDPETEVQTKPLTFSFSFLSSFHRFFRLLCTTSVIQPWSEISCVKEGVKFKSLKKKIPPAPSFSGISESVRLVRFVLVLFMSHTSRSQLTTKFLFLSVSEAEKQH